MNFSRTMLMLVCSAVAAACGSVPATRNAAVANTSPSPAKSVVPTPVATSNNTENMPSGAEVDRPETASSADGKIPDGWQWIDPDAAHNPTLHEMKATKFSMTIPTSKDLYGENRTAPRLLKAVKGDFQIEARVRFEPTEDYQGAGLVIYVDGMNFLRLERSFGGLREGGSGIRLDARKRDRYESLTTPGEIPTTAKDVELKIVRRGNVFTAFWRIDENAEWREVEEFSSVMYFGWPADFYCFLD